MRVDNKQKALILDFGGVVTRTLFETHRHTERALGLQPDTLTWLGPFDPSTDPLWVEMQNRAITERDYWMTRTREVGALLGEALKIAKIVRLEVHGPAAELAKLKAPMAGLNPQWFELDEGFRRS